MPQRNDEPDHEFYSDRALKLWKKRIVEIEKQCRRRSNPLSPESVHKTLIPQSGNAQGDCDGESIGMPEMVAEG